MDRVRARSVLSKAHGDGLRSLLLAALGLGPLAACGGETSSDGNAQGGTTSLGGASSSGGNTSPGGASTTGGRGSGGGSSFPCNEPTPNDPGLGYTKCEGDWYHRPEPVTCASKLPRDLVLPPTMTLPGDDCTTDADCAGVGPHAYCTSGGEVSRNVCAAGCVQDSDCSEGSICMCGEFIGTCVSASCVSDRDCGPNLLCASMETRNGCARSFACQTAADSCVSLADCPNGECLVGPAAGPRICALSFCISGRPFLVQAELRVARLSERTDWCASLQLDVSALEPELRVRLAEHWSRTALMEHASVAAFARFTLELLMLGAPAELIEAAGQAQRDEIRHARLAFALASAYAGEARGPGALAVERSLENGSLEAVTLNAFIKGCVGETVAALEARIAAERAHDPVVRAVLEQIAGDEARHAALAFRFVKWALELAGPALGWRLSAALAVPLPEVASDSASDSLARHCLLTDVERAALFDSTLRDVVAPCLEALLAARRAPGQCTVALGGGRVRRPNSSSAV